MLNHKKYIDIDIRGRRLHTLEVKGAVAEFRVFSGLDCLAHHIKRMNLPDSDIIIYHLFQIHIFMLVWPL